jgi:hypothetical protein
VTNAVKTQVALPELSLDGWEATKDTLHLWTQIVGKVRMASTPPRNHWWHVPLYVDVRGLTTRRKHSPSGVTFQIDFDSSITGSSSGRTAVCTSRSSSSTGSPSQHSMMRTPLLAFFESAHKAGATLAGWDRSELASSWCPDPPTLGALLGR